MNPLSLLPQPILPAHPDWVELYWKAWELAVQNIAHGTPQNGFAESYLDDAFSENIFQWDTCFIIQYARYGWHCLPVLPALDNFYHKQETDGYICREYRGCNGAALWSKSSADATNPDPGTYDLDTLEALFRTENLGMLITGHWLRGALVAPGVRMSFGFRPLPRKAQDATLASCDYVVMFGASPRQQEAWQFVDFIYRPENRKDFFDPREGKSVIPELSASLETMPAQKFWEEVRSSLEVARFMPLEPDWPEIANLLAEKIAAACAGEKSSAKALTDAAEAAQDLIDARRAGVGEEPTPPTGQDGATSAPTVGHGARAFGGAGVRS